MVLLAWSVAAKVDVRVEAIFIRLLYLIDGLIFNRITSPMNIFIGHITVGTSIQAFVGKMLIF